MKDGNFTVTLLAMENTVGVIVMKTLLKLLPLIVLAACATSGDFETHQDPAVSMAGMQTYRILPNRMASPNAPETLATAKREIEHAIEDTLAAKGYRRVQDGTADFEVEYLMYVTERYQEGAHDRYVFNDSVRVMRGAGSLLDNPIRKGNLHMHLLENGKPFYEAIASDVVESNMPIEKRIRATVPGMLNGVPARN